MTRGRSSSSTIEEQIKALSRKELLARLSRKERIKGLSVDEIIRALPLETLKELARLPEARGPFTKLS